jgi:hypothetical protein
MKLATYTPPRRIDDEPMPRAVQSHEALHKNSTWDVLRSNSNGVRKFQPRVGFATLGTKIVTTSTPKEFANAFSVACATRQETEGWKPNSGVKFANAFGV